MKNEARFPYERLIIVAYRLPYKFINKKEGVKAYQNSGGLVSAVLSLSDKLHLTDSDGNEQKIVWVGAGKDISPNTINKQVTLQNFDLLPVHIPGKISEKYYGGFCNDTIWPLFHYFPSKTTFDDSYFDAYFEANRLFYQQIKSIIRPGDFIWVHDYQLFLVPEMIRRDFPQQTVGFFLHIPFPSDEIFRLLPRTCNHMILRGMLGADIIGFHTKAYADYFLRSVQRSLGLKIQYNTIRIEGRVAKAIAFPIGIDYEKFNEACLSSRVTNEKRKLKSQIKNNKLVLSVDRLDYTKGIVNRLNGIEYFLGTNPSWHDKVIFNMVVVPSRDSIEQYKQMKMDIEATVGRINGKYSHIGWRPIIYQYTSLSFTELVARYNISNVGLITPLRDGMNLVAKEYVSCQIEKKGVLILSEMAGASAELKEALLINPYDASEMAEAIKIALEMPVTEIERRLLKMQKRIRDYTVFKWADEFFRYASLVRKLN